MYNIEYVDPDSSHYNSNVNVGLIGDQSIHANTLLNNVTEITFYVVNSKESIKDEEKDDEEIIDDIEDEDLDIIEDMIN